MPVFYRYWIDPATGTPNPSDLLLRGPALAVEVGVPDALAAALTARSIRGDRLCHYTLWGRDPRSVRCPPDVPWNTDSASRSDARHRKPTPRLRTHRPPRPRPASGRPLDLRRCTRALDARLLTHRCIGLENSTTPDARWPATPRASESQTAALPTPLLLVAAVKSESLLAVPPHFVKSDFSLPPRSYAGFLPDGLWVTSTIPKDSLTPSAKMYSLNSIGPVPVATRPELGWAPRSLLMPARASGATFSGCAGVGFRAIHGRVLRLDPS